MGEISVRMGEMAVSADPAVVLVSIGLGSCIGLALVDAPAGVCGLAHIMLPGPGDVERRAASTFADTGGGSGRTIRLYLAEARVTACVAGGIEADLYGRSRMAVAA